MKKLLLTLLLLLMPVTLYSSNITGSSSIPSFFIDATRGAITGFSTERVFGRNPDIDTGTSPEDLWAYGGTYTYSTSAVIYYISSTNAGDNQTVKIVGLDGSYNEQTVTVTLNGQTKTQIGTGETFIRLFEVENTGSTDWAGDIYVYEDDTVTGGIPNTVTKIRGFAEFEDNHSEGARFTIPAGKTGYLVKVYGGINKGILGSNTKDVNVNLWVREFGEVFVKELTYGVGKSNGGNIEIDLSMSPMVLNEKADVKLSAEVSDDNSDVYSGFSIVLVDN